MEKLTMVDDIEQVLGISLDPYAAKLQHASDRFEQLEKRLDPILDKPYSDDTPNYCCGDVLLEIKDAVDDAVIQLKYVRDVIFAKISAWQAYPDSCEGDEFARYGFVNGYMRAINKNR